MQFYRYIFCFALLFTISQMSYGQSTEPTPDGEVSGSQIKTPITGLWLGLYTKLRIGERTFYYAETHYRRQNSLDNNWDFAGRMGKLYNRHGINYLVNNYFEVTAGPVLVLAYGPDRYNPKYERMVPEFRIWHQYLLIQPQMGRVKVYHQLRFEHRFRRGYEVTDTEYNYTNRYRYKIYAYIPLNKPYLVDKTIYFSPSAEIFLHSGESIVSNPLEDFRIYPIIGYIINENFMCSAGYTWTLGQATTGYEYNQSHLLRLNLYVNFDLRRKSKIIPRVHMED